MKTIMYGLATVVLLIIMTTFVWCDEMEGLTGKVAGYVRDVDTRDGINGVMVRSTGIGVTQTTGNGQYLLSEIPGRWTISFSKTGYTTVRKGVTIDDPNDYVRLDVNLSSHDSDLDGLRNSVDNCIDTPNGPNGGTCICSDGSKNGMNCDSDLDCRTCTVPGICSKSQEDSNGDDIGDACDGCVVNDFECCYDYWN